MHVVGTLSFNPFPHIINMKQATFENILAKNMENFCKWNYYNQTELETLLQKKKLLVMGNVSLDYMILK